jgi:perosamine synthetase
MSNLTASLGIAQIKKIDKIIQMRREKARYMTRQLSQIGDITLPNVTDNVFNIYQMYTIRLKGDEIQRDNLMKYLNRNGIMAKVYFEPVHLSKFYKDKFGYKGGELPVTEKISGQVLTLPMYPMLSEEEIDYIAEKIADFFARGDK